MSLIACIGCGGQFPETDGPTHRYIESSSGCWACYGEVLAREYSDLQYQKVHRLTVDAYAVQHPGRPSPQSIQSVALHLVSLCAIFEGEVQMNEATKIIAQAADRKERFAWLAPPSSRGALTVAEVHRAADAQEHARLIRQWAFSAWSAWSEHHPRIRRWFSEISKSV